MDLLELQRAIRCIKNRLETSKRAAERAAVAVPVSTQETKYGTVFQELLNLQAQGKKEAYQDCIEVIEEYFGFILGV